MAGDKNDENLRQLILESIVMSRAEKHGDKAHIKLDLHSRRLPAHLLKTKDGFYRLGNTILALLTEITADIPTKHIDVSEEQLRLHTVNNMWVEGNNIFCDFSLPAAYYPIAQQTVEALRAAVQKDVETYQKGMQDALPGFLNTLMAKVETDFHVESHRTPQNEESIDKALARVRMVATYRYMDMWERNNNSPYAQKDTGDKNKKNLAESLEALRKACGAEAAPNQTNLYLQGVESFMNRPGSSAPTHIRSGK